MSQPDRLVTLYWSGSSPDTLKLDYHTDSGSHTEVVASLFKALEDHSTHFWDTREPVNFEAFRRGVQRKLSEWGAEHAKVEADDQSLLLGWRLTHLSEVDQSFLGRLKTTDASESNPADQERLLTDFRDIVSYEPDVFSTLVFSVFCSKIHQDKMAADVSIKAGMHVKGFTRNLDQSQVSRKDRGRNKAKTFYDAFMGQVDEIFSKTHEKKHSDPLAVVSEFENECLAAAQEIISNGTIKQGKEKTTSDVTLYYTDTRRVSHKSTKICVVNQRSMEVLWPILNDTIFGEDEATA